MPGLSNQPQSIGKVLDSGIRLYIRGLVKSLVLLLIAFLLAMLIAVVSTVGMRISGPSSTSIVYFIALMIIMLTLMFAIMGSITFVYGELGAGRVPTIGGSLKKGIKKAFPLLVSGIIYGAIVAILSYGPSFLFLSLLKIIGAANPVLLFASLLVSQIPYIIFLVSLKFYDTAIVLDDVGTFRSIVYSHKLVWGNWWRTTAVYMVPIVLALVLFMIFYFVLGLGAFLSMPRGGPVNPGAMFPLSSGLVLFVILGLIIPLFPAVSVALYHDLKLRKSGGDLEARLASA